MSAQITTILLTYKRPRLLRRALLSVLTQKFRDFVVCVYDNDSQDETKEVMRDFMKQDERIRYHCHAQNLGSSGNFVYGWERVTTPFFSILCDDDYLLPGFYQTAMDAFRAHPQAIMSAGSTFVTDASDRIVFVPLCHWPVDRVYTPPEGMMRMIDYGEFPSMTGTLYRREVIETNFLNLNAGMIGDFNLALLLSARYPIVVSRNPFAVNTTHPGAISYRQPVSYVWPGLLNIVENLKMHGNLSPDMLRVAQSKLTRALRVFLVQICLRTLISGDVKEARKTWAFIRDDLKHPLTQAFSDFCAAKLRTIIRHRAQRFFFYEKKFGDILSTAQVS